MPKRLTMITLPDGKQIPAVVEFFNSDERFIANNGNVTDGEVNATITWTEEE